MEPGDKALLLKDLCSRIMYGVKCSVYEDTNIHTLSGVIPDRVYNELYFEDLDFKECDGFADIQYCKPFLFPLSSMTEEQKRDYQYITERWMNDPNYTIDDSFDYLNKNHFDYRGLIPMGLANDASSLNIY